MLMRWGRCIAFVIGFACSAAAAQSLETTGKVAVDVLQKMQAAGAMDLIVKFNDRAAMRVASAAAVASRLPSEHASMIEYRATQFRAVKQRAIAAFRSDEVAVLKDYSHLPLAFVRVHSQAAFDRLLAHPDVAEVYENRREPHALADSLPLIGQPQAQAANDIGAGTAVVVLDTGVDYTQAAFGSCTAPGVPASCRVVYAQDIAAPDDGSRDNNGHGTNVAGIVAGVAPGTKIIALDVFDATIHAPSADIIAGINFAIANKAQYNIVAINMSIGGGTKFTSLQSANNVYLSAIAQARNAGILSVIAAGNDGFTDGMSLPAATPGAVSVGAVYDLDQTQNWSYKGAGCTDNAPRQDHITCFSNSASFVTLLAPGAFITAAGITQSGTSQATPHVAGAVAVLRAVFTQESLDHIVARLTNGKPLTDPRNNVTKNRLNLPQALALGQSTCNYSISPGGTSVAAAGASGNVTVTVGNGCPWTAGSPVSWVHVTAGASGSGNGTVSYTIDQNANAAPRATNLTIAGLTFVVNQAGAVNTTMNILRNGDFERGHIDWTEQSSGGYYVVWAYDEPTVSNYWYAFLCGYNQCDERIYQDVYIPADAQSAYLQFRYFIETDEIPYSTYDYLSVRIFAPPGNDPNFYTEVFLKTNLDDTGGQWVLNPQIDLSQFRGKTIRVELRSTTDGTLPTWFYMDDAKLVVSGASPQWDVFWRSSGGADASWQFSGPGNTTVNTSFLPGVATSWQALFVTDINGDAVKDVFWFEPSTGSVAVWLMNGPGAVGTATFVGNVGPGWVPIAVGDVNADHLADIVWRNNVSGQVVVWYLSSTGTNTGYHDYGGVPLSYELRGIGDVNGDGTADLVWYEQTYGTLVIWFMKPDGTFTAAYPASVGNGSWRPVRILDLDGDGRADILWWNLASGLTAAWYMSGPSIADFDFFVSVPPYNPGSGAGWTLGTVGDFHRSGRQDLLWYAPGSGGVVRWGMNGRHVPPTFDFLPGVGGGWSMSP